MSTYKERLADIKAFVFDVDGVLTDGKLHLMESGAMVRSMNTKDGYAMFMALSKGFIIGIITGGDDPMVKERLQNLGIKSIYTRSFDKIDSFEDFLLNNELKAEQVLYMGDDVPDISVLEVAHISSCPADACLDVLKMVDYVSPVKGGDGCVRDVIEQTLKVQNQWPLSE